MDRPQRGADGRRDGADRGRDRPRARADVVAPIDVPGFDRAAMDGYALRGAETSGASEYNPLALSVCGPGRARRSRFAGAVRAGDAIRIMTGAPVPAGLDAVVPAEYATEADGQIEITRPVAPGQHVGRRGEDIARGRRGAVGRPAPAAAGRRPDRVARHGRASPSCASRACASSSPATKWWRPATPKGPYRDLRREFRTCCAASSRATAACSKRTQRLGDDPDAIREALLAPGADVILVSGGSSVGSEDHAPRLVAEIGELADSRRRDAAVEPRRRRAGSATTLVFLLPGNPVSCLCAYDFFAGRAHPAARRTAGRLAASHARAAPSRARSSPRSAASTTAACGSSTIDVEPIALSGASILSSTTRADGFVIVPARKRRLRARQRSHGVPVRLIAGTAQSSDAGRQTAAPDRGQTQFLDVITRDEATARFREHLQLAPLGIETVPLARALSRVLARRRRRGRRRARLRSLQRRRLRACRRATRSARWRRRRARVQLNDEVLAPGVAPREPVVTGGRRRSPPAACCRAAPTPC